jgi:hypothetical protein
MCPVIAASTSPNSGVVTFATTEGIANANMRLFIAESFTISSHHSHPPNYKQGFTRTTSQALKLQAENFSNYESKISPTTKSQ